MALWNRLTVLYVPLCCMRLRLHTEWLHTDRPHIDWLRNREERAASAQSPHCISSALRIITAWCLITVCTVCSVRPFPRCHQRKVPRHPCPFARMPALP